VIIDLSVGNYTLTATDFTSCPASATIYLPVQVGIEELFAEQVKIYPNPLNSFAKIEFPEEENYNIGLTDLSGKLLKSTAFYGKQFLLDRDGLGPGIYFLSVKRDNGAVFLKKLVVE
jgi:hypothetical protein